MTAPSPTPQELPEEIATAIEALCVVERRNGGTFFGSERGRIRREEEATEARSALTAAILSRLTNGAPASPSGPQASPEAPTDPRPMGFDPSRMRWQPISTAPRDGTEIPCLTPSYRGPIMLAVNENDEWADMDGDTHIPTHWFDLPPAQETEAEGQDAKGGLVHEGSVAEGHAPALTEAGRLAIKDA